MSELNFSGISFEDVEVEATKERVFTPVPDGVYESQITNVAIDVSKTQTHGIKIEFSIFGEQFQGRKIWKTFWLESKKGADSTKILHGMFSGFLNSCGVTKEDRELLFKAGYAPEALFVSLSDKVYSIDVGHREWEGKTYNEFNKVLAVKEAGASF